MTEQAFLMVLFTLAGLGWTVGGLLQWLTLCKQEQLIQELGRYKVITVARELEGNCSIDIEARHTF